MDYEQYIRNNFLYDNETGSLKRLDRKNSNGSIDTYGYLIIKIKGKQYKAHRLAWFMYYGKFPKFTIDHINGNKLDNRICNLQDISQSLNATFANNRRPANPITGVKSVYYDTSTNGLKAKYTTKLNGKTYRFRDLTDAVNFRLSKCVEV